MIEAAKWWANLEAYNLTIYPMQAILYTLAAVVVALLLFRPGPRTDTAIKAYLALAFGWIGVVFFWVLGRELPAHLLQGGLFLSIAAIYGLDLSLGRIRFRLPRKPVHRLATVGFLAATFLYPVVGVVIGHLYPRMILPGAFPCPTTALALVLLATRPVPRGAYHVWVLYLLMWIWAIPFPMAIQIPQFGAYEDRIMLAAGIYSLVVFIRHWSLARRSRARAATLARA